LIKPEITVVSYEDFTSDEFKAPSKFFIKDCVGNYLFLKYSDRLVLQAWVDEEYGKGKYKLNAAKQGKGGRENCTAYGTQTRKGQTKPN
jgi:hypothetical protein